MDNPFELLNVKLDNLERLLIEIRESAGNIPDTDKIMTVEETAAFLKLSIPTIYKKVSTKELSHMKRAKRLYFMESELIEYLKKGRVKTIDEIEQEAHKYLVNQ